MRIKALNEPEQQTQLANQQKWREKEKEWEKYLFINFFSRCCYLQIVLARSLRADRDLIELFS